MQLFKKMGWVVIHLSTLTRHFSRPADMPMCFVSSPRVILCEHQGRLEGLITIKDILKEIISQEQFEHPNGNLLDAELEESLEEAHEWIMEKANMIAGKLGLRRGSVRLGDSSFSMQNPTSSVGGGGGVGTVVSDGADQHSSTPAGGPRLANAFEMS